MTVIRPQRVPRKTTKPEEIIAMFCYYFQQYRFDEARKLPYKRLIMMLNIAQKERAKFYFELTQIVVSPHTKKGAAVKKLLDRYKAMVD